MSTTQIFKLGAPNACLIGETQNAWVGAMYIWNDVAKRYCGLPSFPGFYEQAKRSEVWNAWQKDNMPRHEKIALLSTMDYATISAKNITEAFEAFIQYGKEHPNSSFHEQAWIIKRTILNDDQFVAFNQTSVGDFWGETYSDENEDFEYYGPNCNEKHFEIFEDI